MNDSKVTSRERLLHLRILLLTTEEEVKQVTDETSKRAYENLLVELKDKIRIEERKRYGRF